MNSIRSFIALACAGLALGSACGSPREAEPPPRPNDEPGVAPSAPLAMPRPDAGLADAPSAEATATTESSPCPADMAHVKKDFCTEMDRTCKKSEYDKANHITICHEFMQKQRCVGQRVALDFCIDHYEYPNEKGGKPPVMVDWYDASGLCAAKGKRLCYESEWTAACEGPNELPFPHGHRRSAEKCNIDNAWVNPSLKKIYSKDQAVSKAELARLDRSVPSGSKPECVSEYGVYDLTGNVDEWTIADRDRPEERAVFVALKGGAWGHVRNACRPVTTSHEPEFTYYFVSFRCCKDARSG